MTHSLHLRFTDHCNATRYLNPALQTRNNQVFRVLVRNWKNNDSLITNVWILSNGLIQKPYRTFLRCSITEYLRAAPYFDELTAHQKKKKNRKKPIKIHVPLIKSPISDQEWGSGLTGQADSIMGRQLIKLFLICI